MPERLIRARAVNAQRGGGATGSPTPHVPRPAPTLPDGASYPTSRERMRNRWPVGDSTLKPEPRPLTTSTVRWVCFQ